MSLDTYKELVPLIVLISPLIFLITALVSWFQPGLRPHTVKRVAIVSTFASILVAAVSGFFVSVYGLMESPLWGIGGIGFSIRLDALSAVIFAMIAILGLIIIRFSNNYLDGDANQGRFIGRLAATLAAVQLLVLSGNLGILLLSWMLTSISLHRLLVFYDRPGAIVAARKKFIVARLADACLLLASLILYGQFGTGNLESIFRQVAAAGISSNLEIAAMFIVMAALLKSAQFPTHGWLIEVMETPTSVSALLHAGLLNAGPFLLIRMAHVMNESNYASLVIIAVGGFTALFASITFLTQTSIKTSLAYSSVAHMGFSLLMCGIGAYSVALLHLVAHSFYKAHAFLSSGSIVDVMRASKVKRIKRTGSIVKIMSSFALATALFTAIAYAWGVEPTDDLSLFLIGSVIVMGISTLFATAMDSDESSAVVLIRTAVLASIVTISFFALEAVSSRLLAPQVPASHAMSVPEVTLFVILLMAFFIAVIIQIMAPVLSGTSLYRRLGIHLKNGLYANAIFDRMINAWHVGSNKNHYTRVE